MQDPRAALYFTETVKLEERLLDVVEELKAEDVIVVNPMSAMVQSLPGFELPSSSLSSARRLRASE